MHRKLNVVMVLAFVFFVTVPALSTACSTAGEYGFWKAVGTRAAAKALDMIRDGHIPAKSGDLIVMSSAGYAEIDDRDTNSALDGLSQVLNVGRGDHTLVEIHSAPHAALWFAVYHKGSGACAYLQVDPATVSGVTTAKGLRHKNIFSIQAFEIINAQHLFDNAAEYAEKFDSKVFGGNEFRIVTIANAIAADAPTCVVRSFEFHDHYCPGVTSGVLAGIYLKTYFPIASGGSYFVHSVQPWCKEDALMVMLNTTPGKSGYAIDYATPEDIMTWSEPVRNAATIVYRNDPKTGIWDGIVIGFQWGDTGCPVYGNSVIDKLCSDLYYLKHLDHSEAFIEVLDEFQLPSGVTPKAYARPGVNPMKMLGLTE